VAKAAWTICSRKLALSAARRARPTRPPAPDPPRARRMIVIFGNQRRRILPPRRENGVTRALEPHRHQRGLRLSAITAGPS
jgi:hypothetical protein